MCEPTIGNYVFICTGAVVTKNVPDYALVLWSPAMVVGWMCECGHRIQFQGGVATCDECGKQYRQSEGGIRRIEDKWIMQETTHQI